MEENAVLEAKATLRYARISARKVKIVADLIRGKNVDEALAIVKFTPKASSEIIEKLLKSDKDFVTFAFLFTKTFKCEVDNSIMRSVIPWTIPSETVKTTTKGITLNAIQIMAPNTLFLATVFFAVLGKINFRANKKEDLTVIIIYLLLI